MTTPVTSTGTAPAKAKATETGSLAGKAVLGKDDFLRILVTQLRNQDPMNPMEGTEFATQLAQFSSVEQLIQMGEAMTAGTAATTELKLTAQTSLGASMVGRDVLLAGAKVTVDGSDPSRVTFDLGSAAKTVSIRVLDAKGKTILSQDAGALSAGRRTVTLDTGDLKDGTYTYEVVAKDADGKAVTTTPFTHGRVDGMAFSGGTISLRVNGTLVPMLDVVEVMAAPELGPERFHYPGADHPMMRSLFAGVSGLRNHQTRLDVIGNNIANVNTVAFKASRVTFKEAFAQLLQGASRPPGDLGGVNPIQIGSGMNIGSIDQLFTQGTLESTGQNTDLAIQGDSFFVVGNGNRRFYTRAGAFQLDADGRMIAPTNGFVVQGINADSAGIFSSSSLITDIILPLGQITPANITTVAQMRGNLNASAAIGDTHAMGVTVYDGVGTPHQLDITFTNTGPGAWDWGVTSATATLPLTTGTATFGTAGELLTFTYPGGGTNLTITPNGAGAPFDITFDAGTIGDVNGLAGFSNASNAVIRSQDGYQSGDLESIAIDKNGVVTGFFTNGVTQALAQIALARFNNPSGLLRQGDNMFTESANSGLPVLGFAGTSDTSSITPGALENSNVDLSQEFTSMIITQRGFQANARVITTSDEMLQELVNLKR